MARGCLAVDTAGILDSQEEILLSYPHAVPEKCVEQPAKAEVERRPLSGPRDVDDPEVVDCWCGRAFS